MSTHLTETRFDSLGLHEALLAGLRDAGFEFCTPIQAETLPLALAGNDIAGQAQTGTGKTFAFLLALMHQLLTHPAKENRRNNQPRALVLAPTRELAIQIHKDAVLINKHANLKLALAYGGTGYDQQRAEIEGGADILIGTPGRIIDYFEQRVFDLKQCEVFVLDEADRMFDLGFIKDVRFLARRCPPPTERRSMLFSATLSLRVMELAFEHMNEPKKVKIESESVTAERVVQKVYYPANEEKIPLLIGLLRHMDPHRTIVFVNTKYVADRVWGYLESNGFPAAVLSGDVPQNKRQKLLELFKNGDLNVLVATDVAARGLHIDEVSHVFNYDLPQDAEDYVHRIGRTARAGASGDAISFACEDYAFTLPDIEAYIGNKIPFEAVDPAILATDLNPRKRVPREERLLAQGKDGGRNGGGGRGRGGPRGGGRGGSGGGRSGGGRGPRR
jgi:ATP-dependent RNA helicase RhlB